MSVAFDLFSVSNILRIFSHSIAQLITFRMCLCITNLLSALCTIKMNSDSDSDSVNSADFFDTIARKPVTKVKMGESRKGTLNSSISGSKYGYVFVSLCFFPFLDS